MQRLVAHRLDMDAVALQALVASPVALVDSNADPGLFEPLSQAKATKTTTRAAICSDGSAHAYQSMRNSTPNGRGRRTSGAATYWMRKPCRIQASSTTSRCRSRRKINTPAAAPTTAR